MELRSTFGWKPLAEYHNYKDWLKLAGTVLVGLFVTADVGFLFVSSAMSQYQALKPQGLEGLLLLNGAITASVAVFFLGFIMILSGFSLSPAESQLFALPLTDRSQLASRFALVYLSQAAFGLFMFGINLVVFGIAEASPFGFWLVGLLVAFALAFNLYMQQSLQKLGDRAWLLANYAGPGTVLNLAGSAWPPSLLAWKALEAANAGAWADGLELAAALLAGGLVLSALAIVVLAGSWRRAVLAFGEARLRRLGKADAIAYIDDRRLRVHAREARPRLHLGDGGGLGRIGRNRNLRAALSPRDLRRGGCRPLPLRPRQSRGALAGHGPSPAPLGQPDGGPQAESQLRLRHPRLHGPHRPPVLVGDFLGPGTSDLRPPICLHLDPHFRRGSCGVCPLRHNENTRYRSALSLRAGCRMPPEAARR